MKQLATDYPLNSNPASAEYPGGSIKNESVPGTSGDGTPLDSPIINDYVGFSEALIDAGLVAASGSADTALASDRLDAIVNLIGIRTLQNLYGISSSNTFIYGPGLSMVADATAVIQSSGLYIGLYIANTTFTTTGNFSSDAGNFDKLRIRTRDVGDATTTNAGVIEQATSAEVQNGALGNLAVTPSGLSTRTATETRTGLVEKADNTEAVGGVADKFVDAATMQHALLNPTDVTDKREALGIYVGRVNSDGTSIVLPSGWTVSKISTGSYQINHNLSTADFNVGVLVVKNDVNTQAAQVRVKTSTYFTVLLGTSGVGSFDDPFDFTVIV